MSQNGLLRLFCLGSLLCFLHGSAWANLWAYVDEQGATHFATEQLDRRYQLFYRAAETDAHGDEAPPLSAMAPRSAARATGGAQLTRFFANAANYLNVRHHLQSAAATHGVDYALLQALIVTESGFNAQALSPKGAVGLMQVMPATASRFGVSPDARRSVAQKLVDPAVNVPAGTRYLRYLLDMFPGRTDLALAAYNAGEGAVQRAGNQIPAYKETQNYVRTVLDLYAQLKPQPTGAADLTAQGRVRVQMQGGAVNRGNLPPGHSGAHATAPIKTSSGPQSSVSASASATAADRD